MHRLKASQSKQAIHLEVKGKIGPCEADENAFSLHVSCMKCRSAAPDHFPLPSPFTHLRLRVIHHFADVQHRAAELGAQGEVALELADELQLRAVNAALDLQRHI